MTRMRITFDVDINDEAVADFDRIVDHHIDRLIDMDEWNEIKSVYNAKSKIVEEEKE